MADQEETKPPTPEAEQKPGSPTTEQVDTQQAQSPQPNGEERKTPTEQDKITDDAGRKSKSPVPDDEIPLPSQSPGQQEGAGDVNQNAEGEPGEQQQEESQKRKWDAAQV